MINSLFCLRTLSVRDIKRVYRKWRRLVAGYRGRPTEGATEDGKQIKTTKRISYACSQPAPCSVRFFMLMEKQNLRVPTNRHPRAPSRAERSCEKQADVHRADLDIWHSSSTAPAAQYGTLWNVCRSRTFDTRGSVSTWQPRMSGRVLG